MKTTKHFVHMLALVCAVGVFSVGCASVAGKSSARHASVVPTEFRVRVGLYRKAGLNVARKVEKNLRNAGHRAYLQRINRNTHGLYIGKNLDKDTADSLKRTIDRKLDTKTLVVAM